MRRHCLLSAVLISSCIVSTGKAADTSLGELIDLTSVVKSFPKDFTLQDHALSEDGLLFVASQQSVLVHSPWGWDSVWTADPHNTTGPIKAIACVRCDTGARLLIVTTGNLVVVSWGRRADPPSPWGRAELSFQAELIQVDLGGAELTGIAANPFPTKRGTALGYLADGLHLLHVIRNDGTIHVVSVKGRRTGDQIAFSPAGYALAWEYRGRAVTILSPSGEVVGRVDLQPVIAQDEVEKQHLAVQCAMVDESNGRWYVGTSHGLAVGDIDERSHRPSESLHRVKRLKTTSSLAIGRFLGRVLLAVEYDGTGAEGTILLEKDFGIRRGNAARFAMEAAFSSIRAPKEMGRASEAVMVGPDVVWTRGIGGVWEWVPGAWHHLDADFRLPNPHETRLRPLVLRSPLHDRVWCVRPPSAHRFRELSTTRSLLHVVSEICPDPSGGGLWTWDPKISPPDMDYLRFATPHGFVENRSGTRFPANFRVARLTHYETDGSIHVPMAENGALLLPTGRDFLLCRSGYYIETDSTALSSGQFDELTPAAESATAAWLAVHHDGDKPKRLVALDIDSETMSAERPKMTVTDLGLAAQSTSEILLVPDSEGYVWFAVRNNDSWQLQRIQPGRGPRLSAPKLPEPPRFFFLSKMPMGFGDGVLITDNGACRVAHADRIGDAADKLNPLVPEVKPWVALWLMAENQPATPIRYEVIVSPGWGYTAGDRHAILLRRRGPSTDGEALILSTTAEPKGVRIEPVERRLENSVLRSFRPLLWLPGASEYVIGERSEDPARAFLLAVPSNGVAAVRSPSWLKPTINGLGERLGARLSGVAVNRLDDSNQGIEVIALASGTRLFFEEVSALASTPTFVPTWIEVHQGQAHQSYDVRSSLPPSPLSSSVDSLTIRIAPDYGDWWRPDWERVALHDGTSSEPRETFTVNPTDGSFRLSMSPGMQRKLLLSTDGWPSMAPLELPALEFQELPAAGGLNPWWFLVTIPIALVVVLAMLAISPELFYRAEAHFGFHWVFADAPADITVMVRSTGVSAAVLMESGASVQVVSVPPGCSDFQRSRERWRDEAQKSGRSPYIVQACIKDDIFKFDWNKCISDEWTDPKAHVFSGQVHIREPNAPSPSFPPPRSPMIVTGLGCSIRKGDGPLPMMDQVVERAIACFEVPGFKVVNKSVDATRKDLIKAIQTSHIIIIGCHAKDGSIRFAHGEFSADDWKRLKNPDNPNYCRFIFFLGCGLGDLVGQANPLLLEVVRSGVTSIAFSHKEQDPIIAKALLPAFCAQWAKARARGPTIAEAFRTAESQVGYRNEEKLRNEQLNSYTIIGTPTMRLEWRFSSQRTRK